MYLNELNSNIKEVFLDLCIYAVNSNSFFVEEERNMLDLYCDEMHISRRYEALKSLDDSFAEIAKLKTESEKRIVLFEIIALLTSDGEYDNDEKIFIKSLISAVKISNSEYEHILTLLNKLTGIYKEINEYIF